LTDANEQWLFQTCNVLALRHLLLDLASYLLSAFSALLIFVDFLGRRYGTSIGFGDIPGDQFFDGLARAYLYNLGCIGLAGVLASAR